MSHLKFLAPNADTPVSKEQEGCNIALFGNALGVKHCPTEMPLGASLTCRFAFSLMEEDVFELKKKIGEVLDEK